MDLLHGLARSVLDSAADRVVEDVDFFDAGQALAEHVFYFLVVAIADRGVVCEGLFFGGCVVDGEARVVGGETCLVVTDVVDGSLVVSHLKGHAGTVDFAPWLFRSARCQVDVFEACGCHLCELCLL